MTNILAQMKTAPEREVYEVANMTANMFVQFQVHPSHAETDGSTKKIIHVECIVSQLQRQIYGITSNKQVLFKKRIYIPMTKLEA